MHCRYWIDTVKKCDTSEYKKAWYKCSVSLRYEVRSQERGISEKYSSTPLNVKQHFGSTFFPLITLFLLLSNHSDPKKRQNLIRSIFWSLNKVSSTCLLVRIYNKKSLYFLRVSTFRIIKHRNTGSSLNRIYFYKYVVAWEKILILVWLA